MKIESLQNKKVKEWVKLKEKKYRDRTNLFLIEGEHLICEALKKKAVIEIITTEENRKADVPYYEVTEAIMKKLSNQVSISKMIAVCKKIESREISGNVCVLDNIQDPGNLGTIIRSALAFQIDTIILSNDTVDLYNEKVIRASEGMIFHINFIKANLEEILPRLKEKNYTIYGTTVNQGKRLKSIVFSNHSVIIIGNEGQGMKEILKPHCDALINIPIHPNCESLNASVAASIIFYEMKEGKKCEKLN